MLRIDGKVATLLVGADQNQFQLAPEEVDITPAESRRACRTHPSAINSEVEYR